MLHSRSSEPYKLYVYALTSFGANVTAIKASSLHWRQKQHNNSSRSAQNHDKMVDKSKKQYFTILDVLYYLKFEKQLVMDNFEDDI